jgi:MFS family permease
MALLGRPTVRLLWAGQVASVAGDRLYGVALIWVTLNLTGSPVAVAVVSIANTAPFLLASVVSGWIADRSDGLRLTRGVDLMRAAVVAIVPALYLTGRLSLVALAMVAAALSALETFFLPALQATLPRLVEPAGLTAMVSLLDSTDRLGRILGPGLVGLLAVLPEIHLFTLDAATFLVSAACLTAVLRHASPPPACEPQPANSAGSGLLAGWQQTLRTPVLRDALILRGLCNLAWPAFTLAVPFLIAHRFHLGIGGYGLTLGVFGAGNLLGTAAAARISRQWLAPTCGLAWTATGLGFAVLAGVPTFWAFLGAAAAIGVCTPLANVTINAHIAATVPRHLLARVYTTQRVTVAAASLAGLPLAAALISGHGPSTALYAAALLITAAGGTAVVSTARHGLAALTAADTNYPELDQPQGRCVSAAEDQLDGVETT